MQGLPTGSGSVTYDDNRLSLDGHFKRGIMIGQAKLVENANHKPQLVAVQHLMDGRCVKEIFNQFIFPAR